MIKLLQRISNWKFILPFFLLFGFITFYLFPHYQLQLSQAAGEEIKPLDVRFSYSLSEVNYLFNKLGVEGRELYKKVVGRVDMIYPIIYGFFFGLTLAYLLKKISRRKPKLILIALLPVFGVLFDYLENLNTLNLLRQYPNIEEHGVSWGKQVTMIKHMFLFASLALILLLAISLLIKTAIQGKPKRHTIE
jgi:hypothetical protein